MIGASALLLAALAVPAAARHSEPPRLVLLTGEAQQRAKLLTHCWAAHRGDEGQGYCADVFGYEWPEADRATAGAAARLRFRAKRCPDVLRLRYWTQVDPNEQPIGEGVRLEVSKRRRYEDGRPSACLGRFTLPQHVGHIYLETWTKWDRPMKYRHGTADGGDAQYTSHLRLTP